MIIAFCFLLTNSFPMEKVWERFFINTNEKDEYVIIIHGKNNLVIETQFFKLKAHFVKPIDTKWGNISLVEAQNIMLQHATEEHNADFCCILSGNCIPLQKYITIHDDLENLPISRFFLQDSYHPIFKKKQSQWCVLALEHIQIILKYKEKYLNIFKEYNFENIDNIFGAPDEYFYVTLITWEGFNNFTTNGSTYCNWSIIHLGHPKEYRIISLDKIKKLRKTHYLFARKILKTCVIKDNNQLFIDNYNIGENCRHLVDIEMKEFDGF